MQLQKKNKYLMFIAFLKFDLVYFGSKLRMFFTVLYVRERRKMAAELFNFMC